MRGRLALTLLGVVVMCLVAGAAGPRTTLAQAPVRLSSLEISLWPEYDQSGVLVIYRGRLADDVSLPVRLQFRIPASAIKPSSTAGVDDSGTFRYRQYTVEPDGDRLLVSYENPYRGFQLEYYDNSLAVDGSQRVLSDTFRLDYATDSATLEVQQPAGVTDLAMTPTPGETAQDSDGLTLYRAALGQLDAGAPVSVSLRYTKTDPRTSAAILGRPTPSPARFEDAAGPTAGSGALGTVLLVVAVVVLAGLAVAVFRRTGARRRLTRPTSAGARTIEMKAGGRPGRRGSPGRSDARPAAGVRYCRKCGAPLRVAATYCTKCGAQVRQ